MTTLVFARKITERTQRGVIAEESLHLTVSQSNGEFKRAGFTFNSRVQGIPNVTSTISFSKFDGETELTFTSGKLDREVLGDFNAFDALHKKLVELCDGRWTDKQILANRQIQLILKNNRWEQIIPRKGE